jgi:hypothetical protein
MTLTGKTVRSRDAGSSVSQIPVSGERYYQTQEYKNFENEPQLQRFEDLAGSLAGTDHVDINDIQSEQDGFIMMFQ